MLSPPGSSSFVDLSRPPVKTGGRANRGRLVLQLCTACQLHLLQFLDRGEMLVDEHRIGQWPQVFGWLELGRIRREEEQMHMLGDLQAHTAMPAGSVKHQDNLLLGAGSGGTSKRRQLGFKERDGDTSRQMKESATRGGMHKPHDIAPGKAMLHDGDGSLANGRPDPQHAPV
jgi:hypothetical protein